MQNALLSDSYEKLDDFDRKKVANIMIRMTKLDEEDEREVWPEDKSWPLKARYTEKVRRLFNEQMLQKYKLTSGLIPRYYTEMLLRAAELSDEDVEALKTDDELDDSQIELRDQRWNESRFNVDGSYIKSMHDILTEKFDVLFESACMHYLTMRMLSDSNLDTRNCVRLGAPDTPQQMTLFCDELLNTMARYFVSATLQDVPEIDKANKYKVKYRHVKDQNDSLKKNNERLRQLADSQEKAVADLDKQTKTMQSQIKQLESENKLLRQELDADNTASRIAELERQLAKSKDNESRLTAKYNSLKAEIDDAANDDWQGDEEGQNLRGLNLSRDARILFVVDPPKSGNLENRLTALWRAFPNSRIIYNPNDCNTKCDAVVMLTKWMCHGNYWRAKSICAAMNVPCYHCGVKSLSRTIELLTGTAADKKQ